MTASARPPCLVGPSSLPRDDETRWPRTLFLRHTAIMSGVASTDSEDTVVVARSDGDGSSRIEDAPNPVPSGLRLGRYLVIDEVGRGGMGQVLRAYDPKLQREVALKRVATSELDDHAQARLVAEARAMARLNHPNVVGVYDVEVEASDGEVVLVMEYVPGMTLGAWLEESSRTWREIMDAFVAAGRGLAAAHAEGLLHRDFKLANVLVGADGRVRVSDFGLARETAAKSSSISVDRPEDASEQGDSMAEGLTRAGHVVGTPRYMAPEQHEGHPLDERVDQYAFCVGLWRALTDTWPFEGRGQALIREKREKRPAWPSTTVVPRHVIAALRRGLAPRPSDRWSSLEALLEELDRSPSKRGVRVAWVGALLLTAGVAWGWERLHAAQLRAACISEGARIREAWDDQRADSIERAFGATGISYAAETWSRARARLDEFAQQWSTIRADVCEAEANRRERVDAARRCLDEQRGRFEALVEQLEHPDSTVVQRAGPASGALSRPDRCLEERRGEDDFELPSDPEVRKRVVDLRGRLSQASAARMLGRYEEALGHADAVLADAAALGWASLSTEARVERGSSLVALGRYEDARESLEEAFFEAGAAARDELALGVGTQLVFVVGHHLARHEDGLHWARLTQTLIDRLGASEEAAAAGLLNNLAYVHLDKGEYAQAIELLQRALEIWEQELGADHPDISGVLNNLANAHYHLGEHATAVELHERALAIREEVLGSGHPDVATSLNNLCAMHHAVGDNGRALVLCERALAIREVALGPDHPYVAALLANIGGIQSELGDHARAIELYERSLASDERALGPTHPQLAATLVGLGNTHFSRKDFDGAMQAFERALAIYEGVFGTEHPEVTGTLNNLANVHLARGNPVLAIDLHERALAIREKTQGPDHPHVAMSLDNLAAVYEEQGDHARVAALLQRAVALWEKTSGPQHPQVAASLLRLGHARFELGDFSEATPCYARALAILESLETDSIELPKARFAMARSLARDDADRAHAVELARAAADEYRALGPDATKALEDVEAWLEAHASR
jgi:eukaryotic-like serine/threonine-protein kinase